MTAPNPALPLCAADVERTRLPLERATQLPRAAFTDPAVLEWERANCSRGGWICAGHVDQVGARGDFLTVEVGGDSVFVIADDDGLPRAFHNVCRHRGARLLESPRAAPPPPVPLPRVDLRLRRRCGSAPFTDGLEDFDPPASRCTRCASRSSRASCCSTSSGEAPPPQEHVGDLAAALAPLPARRARAARGSPTTSAPTGRRSPRTTASACTARACTRSSTGSRTTSRASVEGAGAWCGGSMTLAEGVETMAKDGGARPPADRGRRRPALVLYFLLFPNTLVSLHPDYVMLHTLWPRAPDRTEVVCEWFFEPETIAAPASTPPTRSSSGTRSTARTGTCARSRSAAWRRATYEPGRYTTQEGDVHEFDAMVADRYLEALR